MTSDLAVRKITAADTHPLRRRILRDGATDADVEWPGDEDRTTIHLGVVVEGRVVAISTWLVAPDPIAPDRDSVQLRGMATEPTMTGRGLGRALLEAGTTHALASGHEQIWANARVSALGFYEAAGWTVTGPVFDTAVTGLPHRHVHIELA